MLTPRNRGYICYMKGKFKEYLLYVSVGLALIGLIASQVYWISQSYQINKTQFIKEVNNTLNGYSLSSIQNNMGKVFNVITKHTSNSEAETVVAFKMLETILNMSKDSSGQSDIRFALMLSHDSLLNAPANSEVPEINKDSLTSFLKSYHLYEQEKMNPVCEDVRRELLKSGITIPFEIALLTKIPRKITQTTAKDAGQFIAIPLKSNRVSIGINSSIQLAFENEKVFILRKMWLLLSVSILLIAISSLTFMYLLKTIFNQKKMNALKNEFIDNMTHELKTPISTVSVAIEAIQKFDVIEDKGKTKEYLSIANNELSRLSMMVDKVLKTSAFERNKIQLNFEKINIVELAEVVIKNFKLQFDKHHVQFTSSFSQQAIFIRADKQHFTNVIYNLIDNAVKYSGANPELMVAISITDHVVRLEVRDKGIGIPAQYLTKIFENFFRVPSGNRHDIKGYGLGLSYVKSVIMGHKGSIEVASEVNKGTVFTIELPLYNE